MTVTNGNLRIVADENIPFLNRLFARFGEIETCAGRHISADLVRDADVLLVRSVTRVDRALLQGSRIRFVGTCTIGTDHLDLDYLRQHNIRWSNAPGCNANSVVEYVLSALALTRPDWLQARVGIIGCGNVGGHLYRQLSALEVDCHCYDPLLSADQNPSLSALEDVLQADIVCLHAPLTMTGDYPSYHLLDASRLQQLSPGAVVISAGRGAVIDNQALKSVLQQRSDITAVLDVWEPEPNLDVELLSLVRLGTAHIAGYSYDGKVEGSVMIYRALCTFLQISPVLDSAALIADEGEVEDLALFGHSQQDILNQAVLKAFDVEEDDRRLRQLLSIPGKESERARAELFDSLRKSYRKRREFSRYRVTAIDGNLTADEKGVLRNKLATLGFLT